MKNLDSASIVFLLLGIVAGIVAIYVHPGSKLAVMIQIDSNKTGAPSESHRTHAREHARQIAGATPLYKSQSEVPADINQRENVCAVVARDG